MTDNGLENALRIAIENALCGRDNLLQYNFNTRHGEVKFLGEIVLRKHVILCENVCIYAASDPPGIPKATIMRELLSEFRALLKSAQNLGYSQINVRGQRTEAGSSASPGETVNIRRGRKE